MMGSSTRTAILTALLCLGLCHVLWNQVQAGTPPKPSIWADPSPMVTKGSPVTIWCQGSLQANVYHLYKQNISKPVETEAPQDSSNKTSFSIESMSTHTAGLYQCTYNTSMNSSSELSEPLPLVVTGAYSAPSLSAHPGPVVASGGNVSLSCSSNLTSGTFRLLKEGGADPPRNMESRTSHGRGQAVFPVGPVNTSHVGTYRCYVSHSSYPYAWSDPSDPLHLEVTGGCSPDASISWDPKMTDLSCVPSGALGVTGHYWLIHDVTHAQGFKWYLKVLIGVSVAFILLFLLLLLLLLIRHRRQGKYRKSAQRQADLQLPAGAADLQPKDRGLQISSSPAADAQEETLYAAVKDTQPEEGVELHHQAAASEAPQDVTYAQLNHSTLRRETTPPPSQSEDPPAELSMYAALAIH
ncbi:leukocyte immunoglobulin-like receptor subfamily B member 4 [Equus przewalskii]|uniref:Leukocyte immunoglobulin-like receptor subfamily B member 4 n=1 Tax=Equus przewalskii TaxID=9798 RepID=A0ABM4JI74_EQUPR